MPRPLFTPGKTRYPLYRRLGGPQRQSGQVHKISPPPGFDPITVQPVASHYTDYATRPPWRSVLSHKWWYQLASRHAVISQMTAVFISTTVVKLVAVHGSIDGEDNTQVAVFVLEKYLNVAAWLLEQTAMHGSTEELHKVLDKYKLKSDMFQKLATIIWMIAICDQMKPGISLYLTIFEICYLHLVAPPSSYIVIFWRNIGIVYTIITFLIYYFHIYCTTFNLHHNFPEKSSCPVKHTLRYKWRDVQEMHINITSRQVYLLIYTIPATGYPCW